MTNCDFKSASVDKQHVWVKTGVGASQFFRLAKQPGPHDAVRFKMFSKGHLRRSIVQVLSSNVSVSPVEVATHTLNVIIYDMDVPGVKAGAIYPVIY